MIKENVPVAPIVMGTDGGMNSFFVGKLEVTQPVQDNEGRLHAPPIHPGMPPPTLSGPREDPQSGTVMTASNSGTSRGLFGNLFDSKPSAPQAKAATAAPSDGQSGFFGNLFKPKNTAAQEAPAPQGTVLAGLSPTPKSAKTETAKAEAPKLEQQRPEPQKPEPQQASAPQKPAPQIAQAPRPKLQQPQQDAAAAPQPVNTGSLIRGAQPVVPAGSFDGRWAGLQ